MPAGNLACQHLICLELTNTLPSAGPGNDPAAQEVYVEDMVHRNPGDTSTLTAMEQPFSVARAWVAAEGEPDGGALGGDGTAGTGPSFTRVVIGDLKPDVLRQIMDGEQGGHVCQVRGQGVGGAGHG